MKVFISWSGPRSRHLAESLRSWLPKVLQSVKPWMSNEDIAAGTRWLPEVSGELSAARVGVLCVTPENQTNPWLVFEAGALSKTLEQTYVCPLLFDLDPGQLKGPIAQFQALELNRAGTKKLLETLNLALGQSGLAADTLSEVFDVWWPKFEEMLSATPKPEGPLPTRRATDDVLGEILSLSREQLRRENLRLEHSQNRDSRIDQILPLFEQIVGAAKEMQNRGAEAMTVLEGSLPDEVLSFLSAGAEAPKFDELVRLMNEQAKITRAETLELLTPSKDRQSPPRDA